MILAVLFFCYLIFFVSLFFTLITIFSQRCLNQQMCFILILLWKQSLLTVTAFPDSIRSISKEWILYHLPKYKNSNKICRNDIWCDMVIHKLLYLDSTFTLYFLVIKLAAKDTTVWTEEVIIHCLLIKLSYQPAYFAIYDGTVSGH